MQRRVKRQTATRRSGADRSYGDAPSDDDNDHDDHDDHDQDLDQDQDQEEHDADDAVPESDVVRSAATEATAQVASAEQ